MRQVSPESEGIFDLILTLYKQCNADLAAHFRSCGLFDEDLEHFQEYAAIFLSNLGNYRVSSFHH